ncbi:Glutathione S-transferase [Metarhizium brunneum]|uniref:Glutathione S-transferase n=1 Tax=Metarhizium brunneum TaxID=500148 RepID=A0A7D5Z6U7_9HYPO
MSEPDTKRVKTANEAPYELIYWPGIPGRGEFVRLLFEEAGVSYTDTAKSGGDAVPTVLKLMAADNKGDDMNPPSFACPALKHGDLRLSQTPNILLYLGPKLGLAPTEGNGIYHINQIALTILDCFSNEVHDTHHPVASSDYYEAQKPEAKRRAKSFIDERLPKFLAYIQRVLDGKASGDGPWLYGGKLTYADLVLFQGIDGTEFAFPKTMKKMRDSGKYGGVFKLYEAVKERPNIKEYLASDRRSQYSDGIWRHYPELEED